MSRIGFLKTLEVAPATMLPKFNFASAENIFSILAFSIVSSIIYLFVLTNGSFSFARPETLNHAYEALAHSILHGRLDVTRSVIGNEGFYIHGKVYLYYGILPALLRVPFLLVGVPLPGPRFFVYFEAVITALLLHLALFRILSLGDKTETVPMGSTALFSGAMAWFASPAYLLTSNASIYAEPYGCALVLFAGVVYLLRHQIATALEGELPHISSRRLLLIALLSALCLHARPPMAVSLFAVTGFLCMWTMFEPSSGTPISGRLSHFLRESILPASVLTFSVAAYLWMNWLRYGEFLNAGPIDHYGYYLFVEGHSARMDAFLEHGRFDLLRIVPNFVVNFLGIPCPSLNKALGVGRIRLEGPLMGIALLWLVLIIYAIVGAIRIARAIYRRSKASDLWLASLAMAMIPSSILILSYATVSLRYKFEIWPLIFMLAVVGLCQQAVFQGPARQASALAHDDGRRTIAPTVIRIVISMALAVSIFACTAAVFASKTIPVLNGQSRGVFLNLLHPDLPGS